MLLVLGEIIQHMKSGNAVMTEQSLILQDHTRRARKIEHNQRRTNTRLVLVALGVVLCSALAFAAVVIMFRATGELSLAKTEAAGARKLIESTLAEAKKLNEQSKNQLAEFKDLRDRVEDAPRMTVDDRGRPVLDVAISEEQAQALKKPRRYPSRIGSEIKVSKEDDKTRAQLPLAY